MIHYLTALSLFFRACEFLFEILRIQSLEADRTSAVDTIDGINMILDSRFNSQLVEKNRSLSSCYQGQDDELFSSRRNLGSVKNEHSLETERDNSLGDNSPGDNSLGDNSPGDNSPGCFGFNNFAITPKVDSHSTSRTPGKDVNESDSCKKQQLSEISLPHCECLDTGSPCSDADVHRLYSEAALVISEFLSLSDNKTKARDILHTLLGDDTVLIDFNKIVSNKKLPPQKAKSKASCTSSDVLAELVPSLKFLSLEANCIMAETFGQDKKYEEVQKIWHHVKTLDESGFFIDVLHSNILVARLALCEATSFLQSLQSTFKDIEFDVSVIETKPVESHNLDLSPYNPELPDNQDNQTEKTSETDISRIEEKFDDLTLSKRKVTFGERDEVFLVKDSKIKSSQQKGRSSRKKIFSDKEHGEFTDVDLKTVNVDLLTPKKKMGGNMLNNVFSTPKNQKSLGPNLHTPWSVQNRKMDLDCLLQDSDDEMPVFPELKPVTPKSDIPKAKKAAKSKTEPKQSRKKIACTTKSIVCDLAKTYQEPGFPNENNKIRSASDISDKAKNPTDFPDKGNTIQEIISLESSHSELKREGLSAEDNDKKVCSAQTKGKKIGISNRKVKDKEKMSKGNSCQDEVKTENLFDSDRKFLAKGLTSKLVFGEISDEKENDHSGNGIVNHDVFDFEVSPVTNQNKRGQRGKSSKTNAKSKIPVDKNSKAHPAKGKKVSASNLIRAEKETKLCSVAGSDLGKKSTSASVPEDSPEEEVLNTRRGRRKTTSAKTTASKRPTRGKKIVDEMEVPRNYNLVYDPEINISVDNIEIMLDSDDENIDSVARGIQEISTRLREIVSENDLKSKASYPHDQGLDLELIETMRGGSETKNDSKSKVSYPHNQGLDLEPIETMRSGRETKNDSKSKASYPHDQGLDLELIETMRGGSETKNDSKSKASYPHDQGLDLEPIETMRGGRKPTKGKGRGKPAKPKNEDVVEIGSDESEAGVEEMRSSKMPLSLDLSRSLSCMDVSIRSSSNSGMAIVKISPLMQEFVYKICMSRGKYFLYF